MGVNMQGSGQEAALLPSWHYQCCSLQPGCDWYYQGSACGQLGAFDLTERQQASSRTHPGPFRSCWKEAAAEDN